MFTTRPTLQGTFGMVSSTHWLASQSAMAVLEDGGNAYDAAVAAGFVLHVVEPHLNGPAGEVPIILAPDGRAGAGAVRAGPGTRRRERGALHARSASTSSPAPDRSPPPYRAPSTPGCCCCATTAPGPRQVLRYAIGYAEDGHPAVERVGETVETVRELFETEWTDLRRDLPPRRQAPRRRRAAQQPRPRRHLAPPDRRGRGAGRRTATRRSTPPARIWREGFIGEALADVAARPTMDTRGERHTGTLTGDDLAALAATYEAPATYDWNGWTVAKAGGWCQGPSFLQQLALLPDRAARVRQPRIRTSAHRGQQARDGRPRGLVRRRRRRAARHAAERRLQHRPPRAHRRRRLVRAAARQPRRPHPEAQQARAAPSPPARTRSTRWASRGSGAGEPTVSKEGATRGDTCHIDIVDRWGNLVSATPCGGWLQSNPVVPALGFPLGTRLQMAWLEDGLPNSLTPGRRPRTTLTPSLALRDGVPVMAFGTPGGDQQDQWQVHFFLAVALRSTVRGGLDLQGAIDAPNWHQDSFPGSFFPARCGPEASRSSPGSGRRSSTSCDGAVTPSRSVTPGRRGGCARWPGTRRPACSPRRRTRGACRGTPWGAETARVRARGGRSGARPGP